jgi:hypothetical protein
LNVFSLDVGVKIVRRAGLVAPLFFAPSLIARMPSLGQSSANLIKATELIGCWGLEPSEEQTRKDEEDGFIDTSELCFDVRGGVEVFNVNGSTEYGIEGYSDVFNYVVGERLSFLSDGQEDSSCRVNVTTDLLELRECSGSYFRGDNIYRKVSPDDSTSSLFDF